MPPLPPIEAVASIGIGLVGTVFFLVFGRIVNDKLSGTGTATSTGGGSTTDSQAADESTGGPSRKLPTSGIEEMAFREEHYIDPDDQARLMAKLRKVQSGELSKEDLTEEDEALIKREIARLEALNMLAKAKKNKSERYLQDHMPSEEYGKLRDFLMQDDDEDAGKGDDEQKGESGEAVAGGRGVGDEKRKNLDNKNRIGTSTSSTGNYLNDEEEDEVLERLARLRRVDSFLDRYLLQFILFFGFCAMLALAVLCFFLYKAYYTQDDKLINKTVAAWRGYSQGVVKSVAGEEGITFLRSGLRAQMTTIVKRVDTVLESMADIVLHQFGRDVTGKKVEL
ncbi:unnamed protein product [Amoebophrya sp. A25]|nr:unnamed protein product [Amoebophrya sp. A25]|eukprot:GSA25T00003565001.1